MQPGDLKLAIDRLASLAAHNDIMAVYHDYPHPLVTMIADVRAVLPARAAPALEALVETTAWLVEENAGGFVHWAALAVDQWPRYKASRRWGRALDMDQYLTPIRRVKDANEALQFARKEDAEAFIRLFKGFLLDAKPTEHMWPAAALQSQAAECARLREEKGEATTLLRDAQYHLRVDEWAEQWNERCKSFLARQALSQVPTP